METCLVGQLLGPLGSLDVHGVQSGADLGHVCLALGFVEHLEMDR